MDEHDERHDAQHEETVEITTLLGQGSAFDGKLRFEGTVRIDGEFSGEIFSEDILVVGPEGHVKADMEVGALVVEGYLEGTVHAKRSVEILTPARVRGNVITPSLFIDRGVVFEGNCQMYDEGSGPAAVAAPGARQPAASAAAAAPAQQQPVPGDESAPEAAPGPAAASGVIEGKEPSPAS